MIACAILGDSLAAGVALHRHDCIANTKTGITSSVNAAGNTMKINADTVLISLGINDGIADHQTAANLGRLRVGVHAQRVYWILPARPEATRRLIRQSHEPAAIS